MGTWETFDHTADVGIRVVAADLADLCQTAAAALVGYVVANPEAVQPIVTEDVAIDAASPTELLAAWLNELIFRIETRHRLYTRFDLRVDPEGTGTRLEGTITGEAMDRDRHLLDHEVKAVTKHGLSVERVGSRWVAEFILDI